MFGIDTLLGLAPRAGTNRNGWMNASPADDYWYNQRGSSTTAGVSVTEGSSLTYSTVYACVNVLSQATSTLPGHVLRRVDSGNTKDAEQVDHPLNEIFSSRANKNSTGTSFRNAMMANGLLWGNQYAEIVEDGNGEVTDLWNIPSSTVEVKKNKNDDLIYIVDDRGSSQKRTLTSDEVLHIPGLSIDGVSGMSPIALNRAAVALGQACVQFGSAYFGNGAWSTGFITGAGNEKKLSAEHGKKLIDSINDNFRGPGKAFGWGLLRDEMDFKQLDMPFEDAMFLDTRQFQRIEICSIFNVPPSKIQDLDKATFSNVEQQDLAWAKSTILPLVIATEKAIDKSFFQDTDMFFKFNLDGLLRGDFKSRMEGLAIGRQWGIYSIDESRALLDLPPIDTDGGGDYLVPMNMDIVGKPRVAIVGSVAEEKPPDEEQALLAADMLVAANNAANENIKQIAQALMDPEPTVDLVEAFRPAVEDAARRVVVREFTVVSKAVTRFEKSNDYAKYTAWLDTFYSSHGEFTSTAFLPIRDSFVSAASCGSLDLSGAACEYTEANHKSFRKIPVEHPDDQPAVISGLVLAVLSAFSEALNQKV